jgi:hypothetical protein
MGCKPDGFLVGRTPLSCVAQNFWKGHEKIRTEADYFEKNAERMRYPGFRRQHLFVGSGVIEAGCKTVIGSRLKQSGMFWTVRGANATLALRCAHLNGRFEDYWEERREAPAA